MNNLSDIIQEFLLSSLGEDSELNLSRNELASYFKCAPSQINYVLSTRFNPRTGFVIESVRGGAGYIKLTKLDTKKSDYISNLIYSAVGDKIDYASAFELLKGLERDKIISSSQLDIILSSISSKALASPFKIENTIRANILKNVLINLIKEG